MNVSVAKEPPSILLMTICLIVRLSNISFTAIIIKIILLNNFNAILCFPIRTRRNLLLLTTEIYYTSAVGKV